VKIRGFVEICTSRFESKCIEELVRYNESIGNYPREDKHYFGYYDFIEIPRHLIGKLEVIDGDSERPNMIFVKESEK